MVIYIFLKFGMVKVSETFYTVSKTYSFIKFEVSVSLPKSFHGPLDYENVLQLANWPCYWSQFNWVKQNDNTASVQWGFTVYIF